MGPDSSLTPELIQAQTFTTAFRGCDQAEVKAFLSRVASELRAWRERAENLESAWHSAEERAARPPVLDEDTLMAAVGEETASILRSARAAAADMRAKAAEEAERQLAEARADAERMRREAEEALGQATAAAREAADAIDSEVRRQAAELTERARAEAAELTERARAEAAELTERARAEAAELTEKARHDADSVRAEAEKDRQLTIEGANTTRDRILEDLSRRRTIATVQIEQLRAGRERLIESYAVVRRTLEEATAELSRADAEARAAADEVGRRLRAEPHVELSGAKGLALAELDAPAEPSGRFETGPGPESDPTSRAAPGPEAEAAAESATEAVSGISAMPLETLVGSAVDELFARIRATRPASAAGEGQPDEELSEPEPDGERPEPEPGEDGPGEDRSGEDGPVGRSGGGEPSADLTESAPAPADPPAQPASRKASKRKNSPDTKPASGGPPRGDRSGGRHAQADPTAETTATAPVAPGPGEQPSVEAPASTGPAAAEEVAEPAPGDGAEASDADEALLQARESALVDLEVTLTRRLKRALQDEQNDVLDRLRSLRGEPTAERLLPEREAQVSRYADAARALLEQAAAAGAAFAARATGRPEGPPAEDAVAVEDLSTDTGHGLVAPLRRRLEAAVAAGSADDPSVLIDSLGAAYREWKTQRIERLAGDVLCAAFSRGTWRSVPDGTALRWLAEDIDGPCPDCDDDALAGSLAKGEPFPTGQHHPPAHSGCRCLLVPAQGAS